MSLSDVPLEFWIFGATLIGVAVFHRHSLAAAVAGLIAALLVRFGPNASLGAVGAHFEREWVVLANLLLLLLGFAVLSNQFERSNLPEAIPSRLPQDWRGGVALLGIIFF